jgi:hypothetical protein
MVGLFRSPVSLTPPGSPRNREAMPSASTTMRQTGCGLHRHVRRLSSPGTPDHSRVKARFACRIAFIPAGVTRKYRFALPPRSGVGAPTVDATRPLASSRSRPVYTAPSMTVRSPEASISRAIGTPYAWSPARAWRATASVRSQSGSHEPRFAAKVQSKAYSGEPIRGHTPS